MEPASPQLEDGYTRIANELLEALAALQCPASVLRIALAVIRETYGYNRKTAPVSREHIADLIGWGGTRVKQAIAEAVAWGVLVRQGRELGLQKDYSLWGKPEGRTSGFRKATLPKEWEGNPSGLGKETLPLSEPEETSREGANGKATLPENGKATLAPIKTKDSATTPPLAGFATDDEPADEKAEQKRINNAKREAIQEVWAAFGFDGNPCGDTFAKLLKKDSALDGNVAVCRDYAELVRSGKVKVDRDSTEDAFFWKRISKALCCPDGTGWRRELERLRSGSGGNGPTAEVPPWDGWPQDIVEPDTMRVLTPEEVDTLASSPDYGQMLLTRYLEGGQVMRVKDRRFQLQQDGQL